MRTGTNLYSRILCSKLSSMKPHRCQKTLNHRMRVAAQHGHSTGDRSPNFKTVILPDKQQITILRHYANVIFENGTKTAQFVIFYTHFTLPSFPYLDSPMAFLFFCCFFSFCLLLLLQQLASQCLFSILCVVQTTTLDRLTDCDYY